MKILLDINSLPKEFTKDLKGVEEYAKKYNLIVIPYDSSPKNTGGAIISRPTVLRD